VFGNLGTPDTSCGTFNIAPIYKSVEQRRHTGIIVSVICEYESQRNAASARLLWHILLLIFQFQRVLLDDEWQPEINNDDVHR
jgi:hypothetical protein